METKNREKLLLYVVLGCVGLYLANLLIYEPLSSAWTARQNRIAALHDTIRDGHALIANATSIESQWSKMRTNTLSQNPSIAESQLYGAFQGWATSNQVVLVAQRPQSKDSDDPTYKNYEWHADVTGSLQQIFDFLYAVESSPMGLKVDAIELSSQDDRGTQLALGLTVSGLILTPTNSVSN